MATRRVLVVEDSEVIQRLIEVCLRPAGLEVVLIDDGAAGLLAATEAAPDLVLLDVGLPSMDGWEVLVELRARPETSAVKVLMLTGEVNAESHWRAAEYGAHLLGKPFRPDDLRQAVTDLVGPANGASKPPSWRTQASPSPAP
jgi:DNA-binding response OmpR family regulator